MLTTWAYFVCSDNSRDIGSDEPSSPTVLLDKKTRRRFLDLGSVTEQLFFSGFLLAKERLLI